MEKKIEWKRVSPADLSGICCAEYFAFLRGGRILLINELNTKCMFTKVIQTCANLNYSLYEIDIWIGYKLKDLEVDSRFEFDHGITEELIHSLREHSKERVFENNLRVIKCA